MGKENVQDQTLEFVKFSQQNFQFETNKKGHFSMNKNASKWRSSHFILKIQYSLHTKVQKAERKPSCTQGSRKDQPGDLQRQKSSDLGREQRQRSSRADSS